MAYSALKDRIQTELTPKVSQNIRVSETTLSQINRLHTRLKAENVHVTKSVLMEQLLLRGLQEYVK